MTEQVIVLDPGMALALLGVVVTWTTAALWILRDIGRSTDHLIAMDKDADAEGFETVTLTKMLGDLLSGITLFVHYTRWTAKELTGREPPPLEPDL